MMGDSEYSDARYPARFGAVRMQLSSSEARSEFGNAPWRSDLRVMGLACLSWCSRTFIATISGPLGVLKLDWYGPNASLMTSLFSSMRSLPTILQT